MIKPLSPDYKRRMCWTYLPRSTLHLRFAAIFRAQSIRETVDQLQVVDTDMSPRSSTKSIGHNFKQNLKIFRYPIDPERGPLPLAQIISEDFGRHPGWILVTTGLDHYPQRPVTHRTLVGHHFQVAVLPSCPEHRRGQYMLGAVRRQPKMQKVTIGIAENVRTWTWHHACSIRCREIRSGHHLETVRVRFVRLPGALGFEVAHHSEHVVYFQRGRLLVRVVLKRDEYFIRLCHHQKIIKSCGNVFRNENEPCVNACYV